MAGHSVCKDIGNFKRELFANSNKKATKADLAKALSLIQDYGHELSTQIRKIKDES